MNTTHTNEPTEQSVKQAEIQLGVKVLLRDYFAAKALPSILAPNPTTGQYAMIDDFPACASVAYAMADAMIKARSSK